MAKFVWQDGTLVSKAKVEVGGTIYEVDPEEYSGSTPLSASNLNAMVDNIYSDLDANVYSTTETVIGTWLGKPLYRKVIDFGTLPNTTTKSVNHNISNLNKIVSMKGYAYNGTNFNPLPSTNVNSLGNQMALYCNATQVIVATGADRSNFTESYVVLEYTKTTD